MSDVCDVRPVLYHSTSVWAAVYFELLQPFTSRQCSAGNDATLDLWKNSSCGNGPVEDLTATSSQEIFCVTGNNEGFSATQLLRYRYIYKHM